MTMRRFAFVALPAFFALLLFCAPLSGAFAADDESYALSDGETLLQQGISLYQKKETDEALTLLRSFVVRHSDSPLIPQAYLYLARIYYDRARYEDALRYLDTIPAEARGGGEALVRGAALAASGRMKEGLKLLRGIDDSLLSPSDVTWRLRILADGSVGEGEYLQALAFLYKALSLKRDDTQTILKSAHEIIATRLDEAGLAEASFMFRNTPIGQDAALTMAQKAFTAGDRDRARILVDAVVRSPVAFPRHKEAVYLWERLTGKPWLQRAVGVILPESGRFSPYGQLVRRGMDLALEIHNRTADPVRFIFRDSEGSPDRAERLVGELVNGEQVMAIAGPLSGGAAEAAALRAQKEAVPLLSLSQRKGLPEIGDYIFRDTLTPLLQARSLARWAVLEGGMTSFGVLSPDNKLGREMAELFAREVLKLGGLVIARESYAEDATDFGRQVRLLRGVDPDSAEDEGFKTEQEMLEDLFTPDEPEFPSVAFDALFIPDYAERVGLIAPQLVYYGIENVPLLGIDGWNSSELLRAAGRFVEGAVFVDGFYRFSPYPFVKEFVNLYFEKYGEEPSILEAQGFDVANILLTLLDRPEIQTRESLRLALSQLQNYPGVTGATSFTFQGEADKVLFILQIQNGNIVQIN